MTVFDIISRAAFIVLLSDFWNWRQDIVKGQPTPAGPHHLVKQGRNLLSLSVIVNTCPFLQTEALVFEI